MSDKQIVVAGNYRQAVNWMRENNIHPRDAVYASSRDSIRGYSPERTEYVTVGTWQDHPEIYRILEELRWSHIPERGERPRPGLVVIDEAGPVAAGTADTRAPDWAPRLVKGKGASR
jgi:hypothetical protein